MAKRKSGERKDPIATWMELDLTRAAAEGRLAPAFEVDDLVGQVAEVINSGRIPVLAGESGVGKSAVVYELIRRAAGDGGEGGGPAALRGRRVLQFSVAQRAAGLKDPKNDIRREMFDLVDALLADRSVVPFFRDVHVAEQYGIAGQLERLAVHGDVVALCEGDRGQVDAMLEDNPGLQARYVAVPMEEPDAGRTARILARWAAEQRERAGGTFDESALDAALTLTHRFLARTRMPRKAIDLLNQVGALVGADRPAAASDVIDRFCRTHSVPRVLVDPALPLDLREVEGRFRAELLGQQEAVGALVSMIGLVKAGLSDIRRPLGVFMFTGPTGVGKTHAAQLLAQYLFGSRERVIRLNMADYADETGALTLFGDPNGYGPAQRAGVMTQKVSGRPFAVMLLDEFEKAHEKTHDRFLQLCDEGCFINGAGETVSCRSMIIIATSNAGAEVYRTGAFGFSGPADRVSRDAEIERRLQEIFRFEFLNRFDRIVHFHPLSREDIRTIALREMEALRERAGLRQRGLNLEVDESVLDWLTVHGYDADYGARFLRRTIERHVTSALAEAIVRETPGPGGTVRLAVRHNAVSARVVREEPAREPRLRVQLASGVGVEELVVDRAGLRLEAERVVADAAPLLEGLERRRGERSDLLARMNEAGFWEDARARAGVLDRFRELDVTIRVEDRFARAIRRLAEMRAGEREDTSPLARAVERAAAALGEWRARADEEGAHPVWLMISNADPLKSGGEWVEDLARMELEWCRRMHLAASVVVLDEADGELRRAVIEADGPGASAFLEMEAGLHRLRRPKGKDARARIDVIPRGPSPETEWAGIRPVSGARSTRLGVRPQWRGKVGFPEQGVTLQFSAADARTLSHFLHDLEAAWRGGAGAAPAGELEPARVYGENGAWVRDPRTEAPAARLKDVLEGRLDGFLEAWKRRARVGV